MKSLQAAFISNEKLTDDIAGVSSLLNNSAIQSIDNLLWSDSGYKPSVSFMIAFTEDAILLKYFVSEKYFKADYHQANDPVYRDSCVEFFIAFGDDKSYYNLEFNAIGTTLMGYGSGKNDREFLSGQVISKIKHHHQIIALSGDGGDTQWELTLHIPFPTFIHNHINSLTGKTCRANFYKCGDDLAVPHFLSWSALDYPQPNFHLSQYFGTVWFN